MEYNQNDLNALVEHFQSTDDADKVAEFVRLSPNVRDGYLMQLRACARADMAPRNRAVLWNIERKLLQVDAELRNAGR